MLTRRVGLATRILDGDLPKHATVFARVRIERYLSIAFSVLCIAYYLQ